MNTGLPHNKRQLTPEIKANIIFRFVQIIVILCFQAAILFLSSGHLDWIQAWVLIGLNLLGISINATLMLRYNPETIAERSKVTGMKSWDTIICGLWSLSYYIVLLLVAGLDHRFGWTEGIGLSFFIAGGIIFAAGWAVTSWAMLSNAYFSGIVRIQEERGHVVCNRGPYRYIRHPGYIGVILQSFGISILLGSLWSLIPGVFAVYLIFIRTFLEDRTLHEELDGYRDYAQQVPYRLLPGIW